MENDVYDFLEKQEGRVLTSYEDSAGVWTIGIGSTRYKNGKHVGPGETITNQEADELLKSDVEYRIEQIKTLTGNINLTDQQNMALISFAYNEGLGALESSSLLRIIKKNPNDQTMIPVNSVGDNSVRNWMIKHKWEEVNIIRMCFMMWNKIKDHTGQKVFSESLMQRRLREANLYLA